MTRLVLSQGVAETGGANDPGMLCQLKCFFGLVDVHDLQLILGVRVARLVASLLSPVWHGHDLWRTLDSRFVD